MKRLLALAAALIFILPLVNISASADVSGYNALYYKEACGLMNAIGIVQESDAFAANAASVTRADMLKYVVNLVHKGSMVLSDSADCGYSDVTGETAAYAAFAKSVGMLLPEGKEFRPEESADSDFAMMLMTSAAGYNATAVNYKKIAAQLGLSKKLRTASAQNFSVGDGCVMMFNLITTEKIKLANNDKYLSPLIESMYKITVSKAQLVGDDASSLYGEPCGKGFLKFREAPSGKMLELHYEQSASELMGRRVKIYYDNEDNLVYMCESGNDDVIAEISGGDISGFSSSARELTWYERQSSTRWESSRKLKKCTVPQSCDIIYNGRYTEQHSFVYALLEQSSDYNIDKVILIDTDNDSDADLIKIDAYLPVYVKSANGDELIIKNSLNNTVLNLKETDDSPETEIYNASGAEINLSSVKQGSVASVFETIDGKKKWKIIVSDSVCEGKLDAVSEENGKKILTVDDSDFELSGIMLPYASELKTGQEYTFALDHNGNISGYRFGISSESDVGNIVKIEEAKNERRRLEFKIFNSNGNFETLKNSDAWKVNGIKVKSEIGELPYITDTSGKKTKVTDLLMYEMVYYKLDSSGRIKSISTAKKNAPKGEFGYCSSMNHTETLFTEPSKSYANYKRNGMFFFPYESGTSNMNFVAMSASTKIMLVPSKNITNDREDYYSVKKPDSLRNDYSCTPVGYTFEGEDGMIAQYVAIINDSSSDPDSTSTCYVIKNISCGKNSEGDYGYKIDYMNSSGTEGSVVTKDMSFPDFDTQAHLDLDVGDIIKIGFDSLGNASSFIRVFDYSSGSVNINDANYWYSSKRLVNGAVYRVNGDVFEYVVGNTISGNPQGKLQLGYARTVISVDPSARREERVKKVRVSDLTGYVENSSEYSRIIYASGYGETHFLIEYK